MTIDGQTRYRFGLLWILLTLVGLIIGFIAGFALSEALGKTGFDYIGLEIALGTIVGFMQWLALRRIIKTGISWVLANAIGFFVSSSIHTLAMHFWRIPQDLGNPLGVLGWAIAFCIGGALAGVMQQRILRHYVRDSGWWIPASAAGWGLGIAGLGVVSLLFHTIGRPPVLILLRNALAPLLVPSLILGAITAITLIWLMRKQTQQT
jgi:uncharacterized membrane protein (Fun14 family)